MKTKNDKPTAKASKTATTQIAQGKLWKVKDNAVKTFNCLNESENKKGYYTILREITRIARQNKTDEVQASELLWQLVRDKKYYWVAEMEKVVKEQNENDKTRSI